MLFAVSGAKDVSGLHPGPEAAAETSEGRGCGRDARVPGKGHSLPLERKLQEPNGQTATAGEAYT